MAKSQYVTDLDNVQAAVNQFLRPLGFRKKGRTHNRKTTGGLVQVVNYEMGEFPIGEKYVIPGLRENRYGRFQVKLAVFIPCVYELEHPQHAPEFVQEYICTIRGTLGAAPYKDKWFQLAGDATPLAKSIVRLLDRSGLPFLEQFETYQDILAYYRNNGDLPEQNTGRASLEAALVAHRLRKNTLARRLMLKAYRTKHEGFRTHVAKVSKRIGI